MDHTEVFSDKAEIYAKYRPTYPKELVEYIRNMTSPESVIADIGAGTGIFTGCLAELDCKIVMVEPNEVMLHYGMEFLGNAPKVTFLRASAEATTLSDKSVDIITAAQAFHWFDVKKFKGECQRILKDGGKVLLLWNTAIDNDPMVEEMNEIHCRYCSGYENRSGVKTPFRGFGESIEAFFESYETRIYENNLTFTLEGFVGNRLSRSYAPEETDIQYGAFVSALTDFFRRYQKGGIIKLPNITECYVGTVQKNSFELCV